MELHGVGHAQTVLLINGKQYDGTLTEGRSVIEVEARSGEAVTLDLTVGTQRFYRTVVAGDVEEFLPVVFSFNGSTGGGDGDPRDSTATGDDDDSTDADSIIVKPPPLQLGRLEVSEEVVFEKTETSEDASEELTLRNSGEADLKIHSVRITGDDTREFAIQSDAAFTIPAGGEAIVHLTFKPLESGIRSTTLEIASSDPSTKKKGPKKIALKGEGWTNKGFDHVSALQEARDLLEQRKYADVEARCSAILRVRPLDGRAFFMRGIARFNLQELPGAEFDLKQAIKNRGQVATAVDRAQFTCDAQYFLALSATNQFSRSEQEQTPARAVQIRNLWMDYLGMADECTPNMDRKQNAQYHIKMMEDFK
ncbi:MAG: choice-of-anchor D domain-containing protein [Ignavibacteriae bacterium]|nr:choice-of-anchor D domain-containing protein [Ignavibacteriota bacterium]